MNHLLFVTLLVSDLFRQNTVDGTFVVLDLDSGETRATDVRLAESGFLPASTFKVPNTLIGLETGVVPDEHFTLKWDGKDKGRATWNRDHDLASALRESVLWYYQEVARRVGVERMRTWLTKLGYGNHTIACDRGDCVDEFWIRGRLRITPLEQVDFLRRLKAGELPVTAAHRDLLLRLLPDQGGFSGKTGTVRDGNRAIAWLVGYSGHHAYALLVLAPWEDISRVRALRRDLTEKLLRQAAALP